jgi:NTE family protein
MSKRSKHRVAVALGLACALGGAAVDASGADGAAEPRPRVGLVLAGGGAKGGAHVGVLKVLEEMRIPVDCIAGTSMGALVGGGYATGMPANELAQFITTIDWKSVVGGVGRRKDEPIEQKLLQAESRTGLEVGVGRRGLVTAGGFVDTSAIDDLLRRYVARGRQVEDFDRLPIPFRAIATDMVSAEMVVLDHGDLATALRASMAIPGAFAPVLLDDRVLSDGGMVRNIPVDVARSTCADVVIVVDLQEPPLRREKMLTATALLTRSMDISIVANEAAQLKTLTDRDVLIAVPMGDIGTADFERVPETLPLGEAAARAAAPRLARYSVPAEEYGRWRAAVTSSPPQESRLAAVRFEGLEWVGASYLATVSTIRAGDVVNVDEIGRDAQRMSVLDEIDSVSYRLEGDPAAPTLVWLPVEASIGPNVLRPSLGVYATLDGQPKFQLGAQYTRRWVNSRGGEWRNELQLGYETSLTTGFYQPFDAAQRWFVEPSAAAIRTSEDLYLDGERLANYNFKDLGGRVDFGWNASRSAQVRLGYLTTKRESSVQTGPELLPDVDERDAGLALGASFDSRNRGALATDGIAAQLEYYEIADALGASRDWRRLETGAVFALPLRRNYVWISGAAGSDLGSGIPVDRAFRLGGARTLPAFANDELRSRAYWLASANFMWHLKDLVSVKNQALYAGLGLQWAGLYDRAITQDDKELNGASVQLLGSTPIGALTLGAGKSGSNWGFWLSLGRPIGQGSILQSGLLQ